MNPLLYLYFNIKASLFSMSGFGNVPALHHDLIQQGWATERQFVEALAVGQLAPGPNGLWVVALGYMVDGIRGALLSLIAICLPPLLVLVIDRIYQRVRTVPAVEGFVRGLGLATVGIFAVVLWGLLKNAGMDSHTVLIAAGACALALTRRFPVLPILLLAALLGIFWK